MKVPLHGGCACGAIRYECSAAPIAMFNCHCRDCQRATGGPYSAAILVPSAAFEITRGEARYFSSPSQAMGRHTRGFCPDCGSRLFGAVSPDVPFIGLLASSLDDPSIFKPAFDIFTADAQPWDHMDPALPKFEQYQPFDK